ncbi:MAG TPA: SMI1/KNR4 family protein [Tepidisphaeraceae bacterium]|jgi:hypothetical protein|nr:SMI1/KNR4 family protein [Tepidisphaeraceae bacterium]
MTETEMDQVLASALTKASTPFDAPSFQDWQRLVVKFRCKFDEDFKIFMTLMSKYRCPGDLLNVSSGRTDGNDSIELAFDLEAESPNWDQNMIPFYAIGNGDYFCLSREECPLSKVYYCYAERNTFEPYSGSFADWVKDLPRFLRTS